MKGQNHPMPLMPGAEEKDVQPVPPGADAKIRRRHLLPPRGNLAVDLTDLGEYQAARELGEDTLARRRILGDDHPDTLTSASNLAASLRRANKRQGPPARLAVVESCNSSVLLLQTSRLLRRPGGHERAAYPRASPGLAQSGSSVLPRSGRGSAPAQAAYRATDRALRSDAARSAQ